MKQRTRPRIKESDYDVVGTYSQDVINGYGQEIVDALIAAADVRSGMEVLDAMGGNGNLSERVLELVPEPPLLQMLEYSPVQCRLAEGRLADHCPVVCGDVLSWTDRHSGETLPTEHWDRILIKSANHEIPARSQWILYENIRRALKPGGIFANLGIAFEDERERDEFREIARTKDELAGMHDAMRNRHFLTRDELHARLTEAGFVDIRTVRKFEYHIRSEFVGREYFDGNLEDDLRHQTAMLRSVAMRRSRRIGFIEDRAVMHVPAEITTARRPDTAESEETGHFRRFDYGFIRKVRVHREMIERVAGSTPEGARVLDLGCGPGILAEYLKGRVDSYLGIDLLQDFVEICRQNFSGRPEFEFRVDNVNNIRVPADSVDVVTVLNILNISGVDPVTVIRNAHDSLKSGGRIVVSGPTSKESFEKANGLIRDHLEEDGYWPQYKKQYEEMRAANLRILNEHGNYWSAEGMCELLVKLGFQGVRALDTGLYEGLAYIVVAEK